MKVRIVSAFTVDEIDGRRGRRSFHPGEEPDDVSDAFKRLIVGKGLAKRIADPLVAVAGFEPSATRRRKSRTG